MASTWTMHLWKRKCGRTKKDWEVSMLRMLMVSSSMGMCMSRKVKMMLTILSTPMMMSLLNERQVSAVFQCLL